MRIFKEIDKNEYYPARWSNKISELLKWIKWAKKQSPKQRLRIVDELGEKLKHKNKDIRDYWAMRMKADYEYRYVVYASYEGLE